MFTEKDLEQIKNHGLSLTVVDAQIGNFKTGFDFLPIDRAAVVGDGIVRLDGTQIEHYIKKYDAVAAELTVVKFVPASGAATRMFKELFEFITDGKTSKAVEQTLAHFDDFAFAGELRKILGGASTPEKTIGAIVKPSGLGYGAKPKALILFHKYPEGSRTAVEEHLVEGAMYAAANGRVKIHFTVSGEHLAGFQELFARVLPAYAKRFGVRYDISFSQQKSSTDTIAVTPENEPFREADGSLLFRPAGHGALLSNLNDIQADVIFIKTVDNVAPDRLKTDTVTYKKALGGMLAHLQGTSWDYQQRMEETPLDEALLSEVERFVEDGLMFRLPAGFGENTPIERHNYLMSVLDRPMRVCGVVKNEGEPGGGPFWVGAPDGSSSLQIAESSQIAPENMGLMSSATHFNPVDIVCAVRNRKGQKYNLENYTDPETGFISSKSKDGHPLKAQEIPGLWNGAMARWNTVFVEVPISTFSPVKVVTDLLRPEHQ